MKLTEKLDLLMEEKGINRVELSKGSCVPYSTISSLYDKGYENIKLSTLKRLADYLGCSLGYLADDNLNEDNCKPSQTDNDIPEGVYVLSKTYKNMSPQAKDKMKSIMQAFLEED